MSRCKMREFFYSVVTDQKKGIFVGLLKVFLWLLSLVYGVIVRIILSFYKFGLFKKEKLPCPVISVGNLTLGGTGKTPLVKELVRILKEHQLKPVILTRGYMAQGSGGPSDETAMQEETFKGVPILAGKDRYQNAVAFLKQNTADVFILDDGFQHWSLDRDLDIVTINAANPWGNGRLIPRGILREPLGSLGRVDIFVLTKVNFNRENAARIKDYLKKFYPGKLIVEMVHEPLGWVDINSSEIPQPFPSIPNGISGREPQRGKKICAFCGIGDPSSFNNTLLGAGADVQKLFVFTDHHIYTKDDIQTIIQFCREENINTIVTTHKDAVKLKMFLDDFKGLRLLYLQIKISAVEGKEAFRGRIVSLLHR